MLFTGNPFIHGSKMVDVDYFKWNVSFRNWM